MQAPGRAPSPIRVEATPEDWWRTHAKFLLSNFSAQELTIEGQRFHVETLPRERMKLTPERGFVPCGTVSRAWLKKVVADQAEKERKERERLRKSRASSPR